MGVGGASVITEKIAATIDLMPGGHRMVDSIEFVVNWARANSLWPLVYGTACCAMEMMSAGSSRHDWARFGVEVARATPRQADLIVLAGTIVEKMGNNLVTLYEQMPAPKYVIAMGSCAISGGPFYYDSYSVIKGGDRLVPVDVYIPGCPPRPEALLYGIMELQKKIKTEGRRNPWKIAPLKNEPIIDTFSATKRGWQSLEQDKLTAGRVGQGSEPGEATPPATAPAQKPTRVIKEKFPAVPRPPKQVIGLDNDTLIRLVREDYPDIAPANRSREEQSALIAAGEPVDFEVDAGQYREFILYLKNNPQLRMDMLLQITAIDWRDHFDVVVQLLSMQHGHKIFLHCGIDHQTPAIDSITSIFPAANWHEREVYDLFGIKFTGHPDPRRLFLQNSFPGYPLRKDFDDPQRVVKRPY